MSTLKERELLLKLSNGDQLAYGVIFRLYYNRLFYFARHYLNDHEVAQDVVQDVFSDIWEDHHKFSKVRNLSSWLHTLCKNQCLKKIDHIKVMQKHERSLKYRELLIAQGALRDLDTSPVAFNEISEIIDKTLRQIPKQTRLIFEMSRNENKKNREIAKELNISQKTVEANISKALKLLRKSLHHYLPFLLFLI
ncbi:RNA polymerase sigma-70 factor [Sunxiuqinia elliptica]|uniref:RNA polymerase sigma-70 factor, ECF subfamily n=1 Tax=Sunxiuqinia elliptica TaxID=655355 RepID=A0A1I2GUY4_9BACT|nr:RNA polymerase sigma-70 factor [Sunxiuqinia elliptica]SFF20436.1 RNA polymerase sigma-70 factor, ECF subfamily [Sunxiuqinia elliptica]